MKYALIVPDGAADLPLDELDGRTPLEAARTPNIDWIATHGKCGTVCNIPKDMPCGSDVAILSVIGYDPRDCYTGRAPLEAAAQEIEIADDEYVFRCNLVTIVEGLMEDHSAGHISTEEAATLIDELAKHVSDENIRFYHGVSYRHLMSLKGEGRARTIPPHDILGQSAANNLPGGKGAKLLCKLIEQSQQLFADHEINKVRRDLGENVASSIWLWGQGTRPTLESFEKRFGLKGAAITAVDLIRGIAKLIGWRCIDVEGATGYVNTNYAGKGSAAVEALDDIDLIFVHVEAPDEAGHNADVTAKVHAIEQIDEHIVGPVLKRLQAEGDDWRILVLPDHPTPCELRTHTPDPVPFTMAGKRVESIIHDPFNEKTAAQSDLQIEKGSDLMEFFLTVR